MVQILIVTILPFNTVNVLLNHTGNKISDLSAELISQMLKVKKYLLKFVFKKCLFCDYCSVLLENIFFANNLK